MRDTDCIFFLGDKEQGCESAVAVVASRLRQAALSYLCIPW